MKKRHVLMVIFSILVVISSCKKDDEHWIFQKKSESYLMVNGEKYELDKAYVVPMQASYWDGGGNYLRLFLFSKDVSYDSFMGGFLGTGAGLKTLFDFPSPILALPEGTYAYVYQNEPPHQGTNFSECEFSSNVNWWMPSGLRTLKTGTVTVTKTGTTYTVNFSGTDIYDRDIKCYYKGKITELDGISNLF